MFVRKLGTARQQRRIAGSLAQAHEQGEKIGRVFPHRGLGGNAVAGDIALCVQTALHDGTIVLALQVEHRAEKHVLGLFGEFLGDFALRAAKNERSDLRFELFESFGIVVAVGERRFKVMAAAQQAGHEEAENGPEVEMAIFNRRPREREAVCRVDLQAGARNQRMRIFDELGFVEDGVGKLLAGDFGFAAAQESIAGERYPRAFPRRKFFLRI